MALDLARHGADVAINGRVADEEAEATRARIESLGRKGVMIAADVAKPDQAAGCVDQAVAALGGLDILVHSAGGPAPGKIEDITPDAWHEAFDVHVHSAFYLCRGALGHLRKNSEGAIVFVSSVAALRGCPGIVAYGTVKAAILHFTRMLARDLADDGIRVNCVAPGIVRTRFHQHMTQQQKDHNLAVRIPLHREGTPEDVAAVVHMLLTNDYMTGESVTIDGGTSMQIGR